MRRALAATAVMALGFVVPMSIGSPARGDEAPACLYAHQQEDARAVLEGDQRDPHPLDQGGPSSGTCAAPPDQPAAQAMPGTTVTSAPVTTVANAPVVEPPSADRVAGSATPAAAASASAVAGNIALPSQTPDNKNCAAFPSREAAQADLDRNPSDPRGLDPDRDGLACEELPSGSTATTAAVTPTTRAPVIGASTAPPAMATTGGNTLGPAMLGACLVLMGGLMVRRAERRRELEEFRALVFGPRP